MYHEKDSASSWGLIGTDSTYRISRSHNETDEVPIIDGQVNPHPFAEHPLPSSLSHYWWMYPHHIRITFCLFDITMDNSPWR